MLKHWLHNQVHGPVMDKELDDGWIDVHRVPRRTLTGEVLKFGFTNCPSLDQEKRTIFCWYKPWTATILEKTFMTGFDNLSRLLNHYHNTFCCLSRHTNWSCSYLDTRRCCAHCFASAFEDWNIPTIRAMCHGGEETWLKAAFIQSGSILQLF